MDYDNEVEEEAYDFIFDHEEMMVQALKDDADWDYNDIDDLDMYWHEEIVDRGYTLEDAAYILSECHEEESDRGLWEGQDASDAMSTQAAYSYSNDVWFKCEELYNELKEKMQDLIDEKDDDDDRDDDEFAKIAFDKFYEEHRKPQITPVEKDSDEELSLICRWLRVNERDAGMRGGYPVGGSYIDSRCGTGHGMPEVKDYVDFDREFAQKVPWLSGKYKEAVQERHDELAEKKRIIKPVNYSLLNDMDNKKLRDSLPTYIMQDKRLSLTEIREIIRKLQNGVW
jgi:hypothetical protein